MNRRHFLHASAALALAPATRADELPRYRVAVIGHTGRGNYGHGLDTMWLKLPARTTVVAVADADAKGLADAKTRLEVTNGFADYRDMLAKERPDIVSIGPRHVDQHLDMVLASVKAGAKGIYMEKPFCRTLAEADEIVETCAKSGTRLALAHRNRYWPVLKTISGLMTDGTLGEILEFRARGKEDARGGAEDMWVLGSHLFNLLAYFGGAPFSCSASIYQDGKLATAADCNHTGKEGITPLLGNEIHAAFTLQSGNKAFFSSIQGKGAKDAGFGVQIIGTKGSIDMRMDASPFAHFLPGNPTTTVKGQREWIPISTAGIGKPDPEPEVTATVMDHRLAAADLFDAIEQRRDPLCSASEGRSTIEMITAVFSSHIQGGGRVSLPLTSRENPLTGWQ